METQTYNFSAGPAGLPFAVLSQIKEELFSYNQLGFSAMEMSHRTAEYEAIELEAKDILRRILNLPDKYTIFFMQGGASLQFALVPMHFLEPSLGADY